MRKEINTHCYNCDGFTYQRVLLTRRVPGDDDDNTIRHYFMLQCCGCRDISFLYREEDPDTAIEEYRYSDRNYSGRYDSDDEEFHFLRDHDYDELPSRIRSLYDELTVALSVESFVGAGMLLRTLVEAICLQQLIPGRNLQDKIKNLHTKGLISTAELPILDKLRLIGNQSTHEIKSFSPEKLSYALDIVNHILTSVFILPKINKRLKI